MALFSRLVSAVVNKRFRGTPPNPPAKNFKKVFGHLILMHVVIGVFNAIANRSKAASV